MKIKRLALNFVLVVLAIFSAVISAEAEIYINNLPEDITVEEGGPINIALFFNGAAFTGKPVELFVARQSKQSGEMQYYDQLGAWRTFTDIAAITPVLQVSSMPEYANITWTAFESSAGMDSFSIAVCLDGNVDGHFDSGSSSCATRNVNVTKRDCTGLSVTPASISETLTQGQAKTVDITVQDSCGNNLSAGSYTAVSSQPWVSLSSQEAGKLTAALSASSLNAGSINTGVVTITYGGASKTVNVSLTVSSGACSGLTVTPSSISKTLAKGQSATSDITVKDSCGQSLSSSSFTASADQSWIGLSSQAGKVTVTLSTSLLGTGSYSGTVTVASGGQSKTVAVSLTVTKPAFGFGDGSCTASSISFGFATLSAAANSTASTAVSVTNNCGSAVSYTASVTSGSWLSVSTSGSGTMTINVNTSGMSAGNYQGTVAVSSNGLPNAVLTVYLTVTGPCVVSSAVADPSSVSKSVTVGSNATDTSINIKDNCGSNLSYTVSSVTYGTGSGWISAPAVSASGTGALTISFRTDSLSAGTYTGSVSVSTSRGTATISITVAVSSSSTPPPSSSSATKIENGKPNFTDVSPGAPQWYYFIENSNRTPANTNSLLVAMTDANQTSSYNVEMVVRYAGTTCDDTKMPTTTDYDNIKNHTITYGQNGFYFAFMSGSTETVEIPAPNPQGCYYVMLYNVDTTTERVRLHYTDYDSYNYLGQ